jgi:hypothetical protein
MVLAMQRLERENQKNSSSKKEVPDMVKSAPARLKSPPIESTPCFEC